MIGLAYILFFAVYGYLSIKAVKYAANWAAENGRSPRVWGFLAGFAMYNLVFWDLIPVYATHAYYCAKLGGLTVYKTPEEWKAENPGVAEKLTWRNIPKSIHKTDKTVYLLNQRISWVVQYEKLPFFHWIHYNKIVDRKTHEVLAEKKDVTLRMRNFVVVGIDSVRILKGWLGEANHCHINNQNRSRWLYNGKSFGQIETDFDQIGREGHE